MLAQRGTNVGRRLPPIDQSARNPALRQFRQDLLGILARRDAARLIGLLTDDVQSKLGEETGPAAFQRFWSLEHAASQFWRECAEALQLGGTFLSTGEYAAPYVYSAFPDDLDPNEYDVVVRPATVLRTEPRRGAPAVETLRWDILEIQEFNDAPWRFVRSAAGRLGYVERSAVRSPLDPHLLVRREQDRWRIAAFARGD